VGQPRCEGQTVMCGWEWYQPTIRIGRCSLWLNSFNAKQNIGWLSHSICSLKKKQSQ